MKVCQGCEENLPTECFPLRKDIKKPTLRPYCHTCANKSQKARYTHHRKTNPFKHRCTRAKSRASYLDVPFDLTPEYLEEIWTGICPVLGVEIKLSTDRKDEYAAELDRFNPKFGYVQDNVNFLSRKANRLKNNASLEELENLCKWMKGEM